MTAAEIYKTLGVSGEVLAYGGKKHEFALTGRDYASYMNAVSRFNKNGKAKFEARTASASTIVIKRLS